MNPTIREKRHRLPREYYRGRILVSITACVEGRRTPFLDSTVVGHFSEFLSKAAAKHKCRVPIFCFMPDHLHLILQGVDDSADAWKAMVDFKQHTGFWFGRNRPQDAWQKDFYDHIIRADDDIAAQIRYIADNPVRKGLVNVWSDYPFTGAIGVDLKQALVDVATS